jgi:hypothetical protein
MQKINVLIVYTDSRAKKANPIGAANAPRALDNSQNAAMRD